MTTPLRRLEISSHYWDVFAKKICAFSTSFSMPNTAQILATSQMSNALLPLIFALSVFLDIFRASARDFCVYPAPTILLRSMSLLTNQLTSLRPTLGTITSYNKFTRMSTHFWDDFEKNFAFVLYFWDTCVIIQVQMTAGGVHNERCFRQDSSSD